jgi:DnaJ-class molecular chaperone
MGLPIFNPSSTIYQRGDQYVLIKLQMPKDIDDKYNKIIKKLSIFEEKYLSNIRKKINEKLGENHGRNQEK